MPDAVSICIDHVYCAGNYDEYFGMATDVEAVVYVTYILGYLVVKIRFNIRGVKTMVEG